jgi:hypothetical protein
MIGGRWHVTGQSIVVSKNGRLLNGQKQLMAVVESDTTQTFLIAPGIEEEAQRVMDVVDPRTIGQTLAMQGHSHAGQLGAVARMIALWDRNRLTKPGAHLSPEELLYVIETATDIPAAVEYAAQVRKIRLGNHVIGFCIWKLRRVHPGADAFFQDLLQKRTTGYGDPKCALLDLIEQWEDNNEKPTPAQQVAAVFQTWNHVMARHGLVEKIKLQPKPDPANPRRVIWVVPEPTGPTTP